MGFGAVEAWPGICFVVINPRVLFLCFINFSNLLPPDILAGDGRVEDAQEVQAVLFMAKNGGKPKPLPACDSWGCI